MISTPVRMLAWRYLRPKGAERFIRVISWFSLIGIALGVMTLIVVTSVMNGVRQEMIQHFIGTGGHVVAYGAGEPIGNYAARASEIGAISGVKSAVATIQGQGMVSANGTAIGVQAMAIRPEDWDKKSHITEHLLQGSVEPLKEEQGVVIGEQMANQLRARVGSRITLISPNGRATVVGMVPRIKDYTVVGIFKLGMPQLDGNLIIMPFVEAQDYFRLAEDEENPRASAIEITLNKADDAESMAAKLNGEFGADMRFYAWQEQYRGVFNALLVQRNVMFIILMMIILVAAFNIIASLIMLVQSKRADIAILRTMGMSRGSVMQVFMLAGTSLGALGTVAGTGLGIVLALNLDRLRRGFEALTGHDLLGGGLYFLSSLPAEINPVEVAAIAVFSLLLAFCATLYPARRAASLEPAEALRHGG